MDATGRLISTILITNTFQTIALDSLPTNNYLLQLKNKNLIKFIKE